MSHPAVVEAAAVGLPDEVKGEQLWGYAVLAPGTDARRRRCAPSSSTSWPTQLGKSFRPAGVRFVRSLPKTRSAKVVRRVVRAVATGTDPGDLSSLEDPGALDAVREAS